MTVVLSELGFSYEGPPASFECRYDRVEQLLSPPLPEVIPKAGDVLPRTDQTRLLTIELRLDGASALRELRFSLLAYCQIISVLPRIVRELA